MSLTRMRVDNNEQALEALQSVCDLVTKALEIIREVQHYENVGKWTRVGLPEPRHR